MRADHSSLLVMLLGQSFDCTAVCTDHSSLLVILLSKLVDLSIIGTIPSHSEDACISTGADPLADGLDLGRAYLCK